MPNTKLIRAILLAIFIALPFASGGTNVSAAPGAVEVFTTTAYPINASDTLFQGDVPVTVYEIDRLEQLKSDLSRELPEDPQVAKHSALAHIQALNAEQMRHLQSSALGLSKAMQFGIEHYPAILFDGRVVVYGVTDLNSALDLYHASQSGNSP